MTRPRRTSLPHAGHFVPCSSLASVSWRTGRAPHSYRTPVSTILGKASEGNALGPVVSVPIAPRRRSAPCGQELLGKVMALFGFPNGHRLPNRQHGRNLPASCAPLRRPRGTYLSISARLVGRGRPTEARIEQVELLAWGLVAGTDINSYARTVRGKRQTRVCPLAE